MLTIISILSYDKKRSHLFGVCILPDTIFFVLHNFHEIKNKFTNKYLFIYLDNINDVYNIIFIRFFCSSTREITFISLLRTWCDNTTFLNNLLDLITFWNFYLFNGRIGIFYFFLTLLKYLDVYFKFTG